jgi:phenylalanyl-tRNA synthetase alpha chain
MNSMDNIDKLLQEASVAIANTSNLQALELVRTAYLGKKGILVDCLKALGNIDPSERPKFGSAINNAKATLQDLIANRSVLLKSQELQKILAQNPIDVTLPGRGQKLGTLHPITRVRNIIENYFVSMDFTVFEGPEIETDYYNFEALNFPPNHPARNSQDTFYLKNGLLLRTHTSPAQIRAMQTLPLPLRVITPGRVYRCDSDATHTPMFHQLECFVIDENINLGNLKGLLFNFLTAFFQREIEIRFRPSYFPFVEPGAEVDMKWLIGDKERWLELCGCGIVHPNVLKAGGIDSKRYSGLAFGMGIDRLAMLYYGINDLRILFENDLQMLEQF